MTRYFHLYADGKRIREISWEEYIEIVRRERHREKTKTLLCVSKHDIGISKGEHYAYVPIKQLLEVLKSCGMIKDESSS